MFLCHADHTWPACFPCHAANANWPSRGKWHIRRARSLTTDDITILWKLGLVEGEGRKDVEDGIYKSVIIQSKGGSRL